MNEQRITRWQMERFNYKAVERTSGRAYNVIRAGRSESQPGYLFMELRTINLNTGRLTLSTYKINRDGRSYFIQCLPPDLTPLTEEDCSAYSVRIEHEDLPDGCIEHYRILAPDKEYAKRFGANMIKWYWSEEEAIYYCTVEEIPISAVTLETDNTAMRDWGG